eukprot:EG_transcript_8958
MCQWPAAPPVRSQSAPPRGPAHFSSHPVPPLAAHNPYSYGEPFGEFVTDDLTTGLAEGLVLEMLENLLDCPKVNKHRGSVPVEKLHNLLQDRYGRLLQRVLQGWTFAEFVGRFPGRFVVFFASPTRQHVRAVWHRDWREGDQRAKEEYLSMKSHIMRALVEHLRRQTGYSSTVTCFMEAYPTLPCNAPARGRPLAPLPKRGDLVRLVKGREDLFYFDGESYRIHLLHPALCKPGPAPSLPPRPPSAAATAAAAAEPRATSSPPPPVSKPKPGAAAAAVLLPHVMVSRQL